jgi:ribonuclease Z
MSRAVALVKDADQFYIEAVFLEEDRLAAQARKHLTAVQAGWIARQAGAVEAVPMHFSPRYIGREEALRREFAEGLAGASPLPP